MDWTQLITTNNLSSQLVTNPCLVSWSLYSSYFPFPLDRSLLGDDWAVVVVILGVGEVVVGEEGEWEY